MSSKIPTELDQFGERFKVVTGLPKTQGFRMVGDMMQGFDINVQKKGKKKEVTFSMRRVFE